MNIIITNFTNPFSFFCLLEEKGKHVDIIDLESNRSTFNNNIDNMKVTHGQYIAVMWKNQWVRGIVTMESQFLIWLIDFGLYLRPTENMAFIDLPTKYKKLPSHVFEASIHGVMPVDKVLNSECQIENSLSNTWNKAAIERAKELIESANNTVFVPLAILSTKYNDIVLGDLYCEIKGRFMNLIQALEKWPIFVQQNGNIYIQNLQTFYNTHRRHRACLLKPEFPSTTLANITLSITYQEYKSISDNMATQESEGSSDSDQDEVDGTAIVPLSMSICDGVYKLSTTEIEKYANMFIVVAGEKRNALQLLLNKIKDLKMCENDKNLNSVGRATSRSSTRLWESRNVK